MPKSSQKRLGLITVFLVCALLLRELLSDEASAIEIVSPETEVSEAAVEPARVNEVESQRSSPKRQPALAGERGALEPAATLVEANNLGGFLVRVVDESGTPLGGIPVEFFATLVGGKWNNPFESAVTSEVDGTARLRGSLPQFELPEGAALWVGIPVPVEPAIVEELGREVPSPDEPPRLIEFVLPASEVAWLSPVRVQLVDNLGSPVDGEYLQFLYFEEDGDDGRVGREMTASPDGIATFSREGQIFRLGISRAMQIPFAFTVAYQDLLAPDVSVAVPLEPSTELLELRLPPTASIRARVLDASGELVEAPAQVSFEWSGKDDEGGEHYGIQRVPVRDGSAFAERVGLGLDFQLTAYLDDNSVVPTSQLMKGPVREAQTLEVELRIGATRPAIVGRFLDEGGRACVNIPFSLIVDAYVAPNDSVVSPPNPRGPAIYKTDSRGYFRVPWTQELPSKPVILRFQEGSPQGGSDESWVPLFADREFPAPSSNGMEFDVGDLMLRELPLLASGRVVDTAGKPVNQAWVSVRYPVGERDSLRWRNFDFVGSTGNSRLATRSDGSFAIRGHDEYYSLQLGAVARTTRVSPWRVVSPGTEGVELVLPDEANSEEAFGRVLGTIQFDRDIPLTDVEVYLRRDGGERSTYAFSGSFRFRDVEPGFYRLEIVASDLGLLVYTVDDITVIAGKATRDSRLKGIDLRGRLRMLKLRIETEQGEPLADAYVDLLCDGKGDSISTDANGRLSCLIRTDDRVVDVSSSGYETVSVGWSPDEETVVLTKR